MPDKKQRILEILDRSDQLVKMFATFHKSEPAARAAMLPRLQAASVELVELEHLVKGLELEKISDPLEMSKAINRHGRAFGGGR